MFLISLAVFIHVAIKNSMVEKRVDVLSSNMKKNKGGKDGKAFQFGILNGREMYQIAWIFYIVNMAASRMAVMN